MEDSEYRLSPTAVNNLETLRKKTKVSGYFVMLPMLLFIVIMVVSTMGAGSEAAANFAGFASVFGFIIMMAGSIFASGYHNRVHREYVAAYKLCIVNQVLKNNFDNYRFEPERCITKQEIDGLHMFNRTQYTFKGEDLISGTYKSVGYRQSDVDGYYYVGSGKNRRRVNMMKGRLAEFQYGKDIHYAIAVVHRGYQFAEVSGMQKIEMENVEFNRRYAVYCADPHTAYYVLTPQLMEYIEKLGQVGRLYLRFEYGKVHVLLDGIKGVFEPSIKTPFDQTAEMSRAWRDMSQLTGIIDILQLNDDIEEKNRLREEI